ncbi:MAG: hypothetical protein IJY60_05295 [Bacteroides sp.]|nr:hypothetical protein [Bacteroides sp.]
MDWTTIFTVLLSVGVLEFVKWMFTRKSNARIVKAQADTAELKNDVDQFHFLRERLEFKDKELVEKEKRFVEQTNIVRDLNRQLLDQTIENGKLQARISELEAERRMKLCERRGCMERQPQSGY